MFFRDIPGHEQEKQRLREMADSGRVPHALLLEGPEGTAKFALARAFAQYLHCEHRADGEACGVCPACRQHAAMQHIDTIYSFPVVKNNSKPTISDDYVREFRDFVGEHPWMDFNAWTAKLEATTAPSIYVQEGAELNRRLSYTSHSKAYNVVLMWLPERMELAAANKMLKLIEEPFPGTVFIMTSDNPRQILPTIYSRVQRIAVRRYPAETVAAWLASAGVDAGAAADAAAVCEGSLNRALQLVGAKGDNDRHLDGFIQLMRLAYQKDISGLKAWSQKVGAEKREPLTRFLDYCLRMLRENFVTNFHRPDFNVVTAKEAAFSANFARFVNERNVLAFIEHFTTARNDIFNNANARIVLFDLAVTVVLILRK